LVRRGRGVCLAPARPGGLRLRRAAGERLARGRPRLPAVAEVRRRMLLLVLRVRERNKRDVRGWGEQPLQCGGAAGARLALRQGLGVGWRSGQTARQPLGARRVRGRRGQKPAGAPLEQLRQTLHLARRRRGDVKHVHACGGHEGCTQD